MSNAIDNRVVQMEFDNQRFEKNVATSISTLDKLKAALKLDGATKGLEAVEKTSASLNLASIGTAVESISSKFTLFGMIGVKALERIAETAVSTGERLIKSMTIDQLRGGWDKYEEKVTAVQTIMSATSDTWQKDADAIVRANDLLSNGMPDPRKAYEFAAAYAQVESGLTTAKEAAESLGMTAKEYDSAVATYGKSLGSDMTYAGSQMDYVNEQMEKLNWFSDETSYSFTDMVSNVGKFTANNIPLSQAATAMQGIATWAAVSGQKAGTASRAMYNMAQAIGVGAVKLMDWKSIENANMATAEFKKHAMDAAVAVGLLTKGTDGLYKTTKGTQVTVENFSQTLSEGWFNKEVLLSTLDEYGGFTDALYKVSDASGLTATDLLSLVEAEKKGTLTQAMINEAAAEGSMSAEELSKKVKELADDEYKLGLKAFRAAQEATTFHDAIDATKDAASTKWMNIFENIFGDYERARHVWTDFANFLYDTLVSPLEKVEELSQAFKSPLEGFSKGLQKASDASKLTKGELLELIEAERAGTLTQEQLNAAAEKGEMSVEELGDRVSELASASFGELTDGLAELADQTGLATDELLALVQAQKNGTLDADQLAAAAEKAGISVEELSESITELTENTDQSGLDRIVEGIKGIAQALLFGGGDDLFQRGILGSIKEGFERVIPPMELTKETIVDLINRFRDWATNLKLSGKQMSALRQAGQGLASVLLYIGNTIRNFWDATANLREALKGLAGSIGNLVLKLLGSQKDIDTTGASAEGFQKICDKLAEVIDKVSEAIDKVDLDGLKEKFSGVSKILETVKGAFDKVITAITSTDFSGAIGKVVDWIKEKFALLKEYLSTFDWGKAFKGLAGTGIVALIGGKLFKLFSNLESPLKAFDGLKDKVGDILDGIKGSLASFQKGVAVDSIKKIAEAILILAAALLILGFVNYDNAIYGITAIAGIMIGLYAALQSMGKIDKAKIAALAAGLIAAAAAMLIMAVALAVLAGAIALFALVAKMDTFAEGLGTMVIVLFTMVAALEVMSKMSPKVIVAATALLIVAAALVVLAGALALFALVSKMGDAAAYGLLYMAATLAVVCTALVVLGKMFEKNIGPILAASAALLVASVALLVLAAAFAAFALVASMDSAGEGLGALIVMLAALTVALIVLGGTGPVVLAGAAALLVAAAACLVLAAAVGVVALVLPLLAIGLTALGGAIGSALTAIGQGAQDFLVSLSDALVAVGDAIATVIQTVLTGIGEGINGFATEIGSAVATLGADLGQAVASLGEGIGEAITALIASVGEGIAQGMTAISDAIGGFGDSLTNAGSGITNFGESIRSLQGIDWLGTAIGIGEIAKALKKLKPQDLASSMGPAAESIMTAVMGITTALQAMGAQMIVIGQEVVTSFSTGIQNSSEQIQVGVTTMVNTATTTLTTAVQSVAMIFEQAGRELSAAFSRGINDGSNQDAGAMIGQQLVNTVVLAINNAAQITETSQVAVEIGKRFGNGFVKGIELKFDKAQKAGSDTVTYLLQGFTQREADAMNAGGTLGDTFLAGFAAKVGLSVETIQGTGQQIATEATAGIDGQTETANASGLGLISAVSAGFTVGSADLTTNAVTASTEAAASISGTSGEWTTAGEQLGQGLVEGLNNKLDDVQTAAAALAAAAAEALRAAAQIKSPSRVTTRLGEFWGAGFVRGISSSIGSAENAANAMVDATINTLSNAKNLIGRILEDDFTPVITPVLDTSSIGSSLENMSNLSVTAGVRTAQNVGTVMSQSQLQNGNQTPQTAVLSDSAIKALMSKQQAPGPITIEFTGDLAQLARVLHPVILDQYNYHGDSLIK